MIARSKRPYGEKKATPQSEAVRACWAIDAEHSLIAGLHERLLSAIPEVDGLASATRYQAAGQTAAIGGDWFEGLVLDDGTIAVVLGDVTGHGLTAAADMALIRGLITALLHDDVQLQNVFTLVSRVLTRRPDDLLATAAVAIVDTTASTVTYATAGHPPPLDPAGSHRRAARSSQRPDARDRDLRRKASSRRSRPAPRSSCTPTGWSNSATVLHRRRRHSGGVLDRAAVRPLGGAAHRHPVRKLPRR